MDKVKKIIKTHPRVAVAVALLLAFTAGLTAMYLYAQSSTERLQGRYSLLAKRILIDNPNDILLNFSGLKLQYSNYLANNNHTGDGVSIFFEYLPSGTSIGINEAEQLVGASLLKTPLAVNLYKAAEQGKIDLDAPVKLKKEWLNSQYGNLYKKGEGYQLTLREAAKIMLIESDNTASLAIYAKLSEVMPLDEKLLNFIDIDFDVNKDASVRLGAESYSSILKCLYFSCYTNRESSQEILGYLLAANDSSRLKLYLDDSAVVAHKIGTYDTAETRVQSDCGIFYVPSRNYLLCVMVKGDDPIASRVIGDISKLTYDFISANK